MNASVRLFLAIVMVIQSAPARAQMIQGRILNETGDPIRSQALSGTVQCLDRSGRSAMGRTVVTDDQGRFQHRLRKACTEDAIRTFTVSMLRGPHKTSLSGLIDMTSALGDSHDLGDIYLIDPLSPSRWTRFGDEALILELSKWSSVGMTREVESCLREMGRRGGETLAAHLRSELRSDDSPTDRRRALTYTRALRIAEGRRDPLAIVSSIGDETIFQFPTLPVAKVTLENRDPEARLTVTQGGNYRSGRFARYKVELVRDDGLRVQPSAHPGHMLGGVSRWQTLGPGEALQLPDCWFTSFVELPPPGLYTARILYHDSHVIATSADARAFMVTEADPIQFEIRPRTVQPTRAEHALFQRSIREIDVAKPVVLTWSTWASSLAFEGEPSSPEDILFRAGWDALPALLEALSDPDIDLDRADWITALCFNITGLFPPTTPAFPVFPRSRWADRWPGSDGHPIRHRQGPTLRASTQEKSHRRAYHDSWRSIRPGIQLELRDAPRPKR